nr:MAG TPA: hypothetical protein [Caudoviricetes sp.]
MRIVKVYPKICNVIVTGMGLTSFRRLWLNRPPFCAAPLSDPFRGASIIPCRAADCQFLLSLYQGQFFVFARLSEQIRQRLCLRIHVGTLDIIPLVHLLLPAGPTLLLRIHAGGDVYIHALFLADCLDCHAILIKTICHNNSPSLSLVFVCSFFLNFRQARHTGQKAHHSRQDSRRGHHRPVDISQHHSGANAAYGGLAERF